MSARREVVKRMSWLPRRSRLRGALVAAVVAVVTLLLPRGAHALLMPHYDLDSLAVASDAVVAATKVGERKVDEYTTMTTLRVTRVYASKAPNELAVGATIELDYSLYSFGPPWGYDRGERVPEVAPEMVFFLAHPKDQAGPGGKQPAWFVVSSGMRIFMDGRLHRFVQMNNPGGFNPAPGEGPSGSKTPFDRAGFDGALERAIARAAETRALLAEPASIERTARLVALARDPYALERGEDLLGARIIVALGQAKEVDAVLDARAGAPRVAAFGLQHSIALDPLLDAADHATPLARRLAALALLEGMWFELSNKADVGPKLARLLEDPERSIRLATLALGFADQKTPKALSDAIVARFAIEKDPFVRMSLYARARALGRGGELQMAGVEMPLVAAKAHARDGDDPSLTIQWTEDGQNAASAERVIVELRDGDRLVHREDLRPRNLVASSGGERGSMTVPLTFAAPVEEREYDVTIELVLRRQDDSLDRPRRIPVGPTKVARLAAATSTGSPSPIAQPPVQPTSSARAGSGDLRTLALGALALAGLVALVLKLLRSRRPED